MRNTNLTTWFIYGVAWHGISNFRESLRFCCYWLVIRDKIRDKLRFFVVRCRKIIKFPFICFQQLFHLFFLKNKLLKSVEDIYLYMSFLRKKTPSPYQKKIRSAAGICPQNYISLYEGQFNRVCQVWAYKPAANVCIARLK